LSFQVVLFEIGPGANEAGRALSQFFLREPRPGRDYSQGITGTQAKITKKAEKMQIF
jgi:hypothetical protein